MQFGGERRLAVPGLNDGVLGDLSAFEFEHRRAKHLGAVRISAALGEGEPAAVAIAFSIRWAMSRPQTSLK